MYKIRFPLAYSARTHARTHAHTHTHTPVAVASSGPCASLHLAPDREPRQHPTTQFFTGRMPFLPPKQQHQSTEGTTLPPTCKPIHSLRNTNRKSHTASQTQPLACCSDDRKCPKSLAPAGFGTRLRGYYRHLGLVLC